MKFKYKSAKWLSPSTLVITILAILLGLAVIAAVWQLKKGLLP